MPAAASRAWWSRISVAAAGFAACRSCCTAWRSAGADRSGRLRPYRDGTAALRAPTSPTRGTITLRRPAAWHLRTTRATPSAPASACLTEDRKEQKLILGHSVRQQFRLAQPGAVFPAPAFLNARRRSETPAQDYGCKSLRIKVALLRRGPAGAAPSPAAISRKSSWPNGCSGTQRSVIIFDEPTRGIDVGALSRNLSAHQRAPAEQGKAILMISSEPARGARHGGPHPRHARGPTHPAKSPTCQGQRNASADHATWQFNEIVTRTRHFRFSSWRLYRFLPPITACCWSSLSWPCAATTACRDDSPEQHPSGAAAAEATGRHHHCRHRRQAAGERVR